MVDRNSAITGAARRSLGIILFLPFLAALARVARDAAGEAAGSIASATGLLLAGGLLLCNTLIVALASRVAPSASAETTRAIYSVSLLIDSFLNGFAVAGYGILRASPSLAGIPRRWAGWLSLAAGAVFLAGAPLAANDGFFSPTGSARGITVLLTMVWIIALSVAFLRQGRREAAAA